MTEKITASKRVVKWRWQERLAAGYLLIFLLTALIVPSSGWLPEPNDAIFPHSYPPFNFSEILGDKTINYLGTDHLGRDVLANLVEGAQIALLVSLPAMVMATFIGVALGSLAGFWGDSGFRISLVSFIISLLVLLLGIYYGFYIQQFNWGYAFQTGAGAILRQFGYVLLVFILLNALGWFLVKILLALGCNKRISLPIDQIILKIIEVVGSVPRLLLVMCMVAFAKPTIINIILLATLTYWTSIARLVRSELLQVKELPYIQAARVTGLSERRILFREALPNALPPVIVAVAFGLGSLMSLEATLSFLDVGIPTNIASWGRMMKAAKEHSENWWLLVFPAFTLCCTILSLQVLAQRTLKWLDPTRDK
ncbi:MAG: ABC transporter permease [Bacteroidota bacterium]|nr:ABC transporter permease [Bacteroidota bacterium]